MLSSPVPLPQVEGNQRDDTGASAILVAAEVGRHQVIPSLLQPLGEQTVTKTGWISINWSKNIGQIQD